MSRTRAHKEVEATNGAKEQRAFVRALLADVKALERMLAENLFETGVRRLGAEQEMFLVDESWAPAMAALDMMKKLERDGHFTTELGMFQLEANADPQPFSGDGLSRLHAQLDELVGKARSAAAELGLHVVLMGILPTIRKRDLDMHGMVPSPRYLAINKVVSEMRGQRFEVSIKGLDELVIDHDSVMLEACNSSFQVHLQVSPAEFAHFYNIAQVLAAPLMAVSANSPIAFGKRLWAETRIALFRQAVDTRDQHHLRNTEARVSFGTRWVKSSILEIFKEDIARFRTLVGTDLDEDPMAVLDAGRVPQLKALRLHNGTIYRWNRACIGLTGGKAHLRIENRVMPAGPSTLDQVANAAFWLGLMAELGSHGEDLTKRIDFDQAAANFYSAAREGLGCHLTWLDGEDISARDLVLERLLPFAEAGLRRQGIVETDVKRYLSVIEARVSSGRTGARWQVSSWNTLRDRAAAGLRANAIVAATVHRQQTGRPVSEWERARVDEAGSAPPAYLKVEQHMTTDLFTVHADDAVEIVANLMNWERIRHVLVEDKRHRLVGIVTQRAILRLLTSGGPTRDKSVADVMRTEVVTVSPDTPTSEALETMRRLRIGCLPVVQADGRLVGILTEEDFMGLASKLLGQGAGPESRA